MITNEQIERAEREFSMAAAAALQKARSAELDLEHYSYPASAYERQQYSPHKREQLLSDFHEADYLAESRSWITNLIREARKPKAPAIPHNAVCFFKDGDKWCAVFADFQDLQESPAGFGDTFDEAFEALAAQHAAS